MEKEGAFFVSCTLTSIKLIHTENNEAPSCGEMKGIISGFLLLNALQQYDKELEYSLQQQIICNTIIKTIYQKSNKINGLSNTIIKTITNKAIR